MATPSHAETFRTTRLDCYHIHLLAKELANHWTECHRPSNEWIEYFVGKITASLKLKGNASGKDDSRKENKEARQSRNATQKRHANEQELFKRTPLSWAD